MEKVGIFLWEHQGAPGDDFERVLRELGEDAFVRTYGGAHGVVTVTAGEFSISIAGTLARKPKGTGTWERLWIPDGFDRTIAELRSERSITNMIALPKNAREDRLRDETRIGTFEAHITVKPCDREKFRATCAALGVKCVVIELPDGDAKDQPMTASFHRGELADVENEVLELARSIAKAGFEVTRSKIERHGHLEKNTPETDDEARLAPAEQYFEYHVKIAPLEGTDLAVLAAKLAAVGGHLSRNARNTLGERFVTLRAKGVGRATAEARFAALLALIEELRVPIRNRIREYTVRDSNLDLDRGWGP